MTNWAPLSSFSKLGFVAICYVATTRNFATSGEFFYNYLKWILMCVYFFSVALSTIQRNVRGWLQFKSWPWWKIFTLIKPLLSAAKAEDEMKIKEEEAAKVKAAYEELQGTYKALEEQNVTLGTKLEKLRTEVAASGTLMEEADEKIQGMLKEKEELFNAVKDAESALEKEEMRVERLEGDKMRLEDKISNLDIDIENLKSDLANVS